MGADRSKLLPHVPRSLAAAALGRLAVSPAPVTRWRMQILSRLIATMISLLVSVGCSSKMSVSTVGGIKKAATSAFKVTALSKIVTGPGEVLTLTGSGFRSTLSLAGVSGVNLAAAGGPAVNAQLAVQSGDKATVTLPSTMPFGKYALTLTQEGESQQITLFSNGGKTDYPIFTAAADEICLGKKFYDETGTLREGTKVCNLPLPDCSEDGAKACTATSTYPAAAATGLADKVVSGQTVAGVAGNFTSPDPANVRVNNGAFGAAGSSLTPTLAECAVDGGTNCVAVTGFPAAKLANFTSTDIRAGVSVAGIAGISSGASPNCASDGAVGCLTTTDYPAALKANLAPKVLAGKTVAGVPGTATGESHSNCSVDGAIGCVAVTDFPAVDKITKLTTGNIKKDIVIAGVTGDYPSSTHPLSGADGTTDLPTFASANGGGTYQWFKSDGTRLSGTVEANASVTPGTTIQVLNAGLYRQVTVAGDANLSAGNIKKDTTIFAVTGSVIPTAPPCVIDGDTNCVASSTFAAAATTNLQNKVLSGTTVAGLAGNVTLPDANKVLSTTPYGVAGTSLTGTLALPDPTKVRVSSGNFGIGGNTSVPTLVDCSADGIAGCVTVDGFKSADMTKAITGNILTGTTIAGISGSVTPSPAACAADGGTNCVANASYTAAATLNLANKVLNGSTVASVAGNVIMPTVAYVLTGINYGVGGTTSTGTLTLPAANNVRATNGAFGVGGSTSTPTLADCSIDGGTTCVAVTPYAAALTSSLGPKVVSGNTVAGVTGIAITESHSDCGTDGATGCVAVSSYTAAATTGLASKVLSTSTVAGVAGNVTLPAVANVLSSTSFGVSGTGSAGTLTLPAVGNVLATSGAFGIGGTGSTPTLTLPSASNVRVSNGAFGASGNSITPSLADCSSDGGTSCVAVPSYTAAATSGLAPKVVSGNTVAGIAGLATAESHSNCAADGATGCVAVASYTAADTTGLASKVLSSSTVAGINGNVTLPTAGNVYTGIHYGVAGTGNSGTLTIPSAVNVRSGNGAYGIGGTSVLPTLADCSSDGGIGCVAVGPTYAAAFTAGLAPKVVSGNIVAGIAGSATAESHSDCAADGATGCITVSTYKAADMTRVVAGNIKSSVTIAGVVGAYPSATYPLPSASATTDLASLAATTTAGSYEWWGSDGTRYTGAISDAGTITPTTINQTFNTSLYRQFTVAGDVNLVASKIKSGVSLFGVTGDYPSATNPLAGADSTADLDLATFDAKIKSTANFEWFNSAGTRYQNAGDADITAANISNGVTIFGATGTLQGAGTIDPWNVRTGVTIGGVTGKLPVNCRNQGSSTAYTIGTPQLVTSINVTSNQLTVPSHGYTANQIVRVSYSGSVPSPLLYSASYYVRYIDVNTIELSSTSGGSAIDITASGANVTIYAYGTGSLSTFSSIDDNYNHSSSGYAYSDLWTSTNTCAGVEAIAGDSNVWKDVTIGANSNASTCSETPANCTYLDKVSGLWWSKSPGQMVWASALLYCSSLTYNNQTGWRLPTQKELMNAYEHGMITASNANWLTSTQMQNYFWSSSTYSTNTGGAWIVFPASGVTTTGNFKTSANYVSCVK